LTPEKSIIDNVEGSHLNAKSNSDVHGIWAENEKISFFPQELQKFHSNIKLIYILSSGLKELHQSDLKPFTQLEELNLSFNKIEIIDEDLFEFNSKLAYIHLAGNKIYHINPDVFDNLNSLKSLRLGYNICISKNTENDADVKVVIVAVKEKCISSDYKYLNEKIKVLEIATLILNSAALDAKAKDLEKQVKKSKFLYFKSFQNVIENAKSIGKSLIDKPQEISKPVTKIPRNNTEADATIGDF
jgi:hypothetical protein